MNKIKPEDELILNHLYKFYNIQHPDIIKKTIMPIIEGKSDISLRFIEFFVTKYCKINPVVLKYKINNKIRIMSVYDNYIQQLKSFDKKRLDPFNRNHTKKRGENNENIHYILFPYDNEQKYLKTTICQLNFFRWIIDKNILEYIEKNFQKIKISQKNNK